MRQSVSHIVANARLPTDSNRIAMRQLSKSKLTAYRQCPKRLWLEVHSPGLREDSSATLASFADGHKVGDLAQSLYDPQGAGTTLNPQVDGWAHAFAKTRELLQGDAPIFEAAFQMPGALALADVLLPVVRDGRKAWRMVEVKSSTQVKDYHRDDIAIQASVAKQSGVDLQAVALAHVDSGWVYPGEGNYQGFLHEVDLTEEAFDRATEVQQWIADAQAIVREPSPPTVVVGRQCHEPFDCGFLQHCSKDLQQAEYPVQWLPDVRRKALRELIEANPSLSLAEVEDDMLNDNQQRVKQCTLTRQTYWNPLAARAALEAIGADALPAWFLDFETIAFVVPCWAGTRPYQQIPFQFSCHELTAAGRVVHHEFLDLSGDNPAPALARKLVESCGTTGPIFAYNASFEKTRIQEMANQFPDLQEALVALCPRIVDLLPIAKATYYHPSQQGSWSIKKVLPAVFPSDPHLNYANLTGVQDGGGAVQAYIEAIAPETSDARRQEIDAQLRKYCGLDTWAMVRLWQVFSGREAMEGQK